MNFFTPADAATQETTQASFKDIREQWKALSNERKITKQDIATLCIYRSLIKGEGKTGAIARLRKSFIPITNPVKLENGAAPYGSLADALWSMKYSTAFSWLDKDSQDAILAIAKSISVTGKEMK